MPQLDYRRRGDDSPDPLGDFFYSRATLAGAAILVFILTLLVFAFPNWGFAISLLVLEGGWVSAWLFSAVGLGWSLLLALRLGDKLEEHPPRRSRAPSVLYLTTAAAVGLGVLSLVILLLGLAGWLNRATAFALLLPGWIAGVLFIFRSRVQRIAADEDAMSRWQWLWVLVMPLLGAAVFCAFVPPGVLWTPNEPHGYDVVEYHLQVPREWYEAGRIVPLTHNVFSYFPFNVEMHYLLAMYLRGGPWAGMYMAQLMHVAFIALTVLAIYGFATRWAPSRASALLATTAAATIPWLLLLAPLAYNEGGLLLFSTLAIGWTIDAVVHPSRRLGRFPLAGLMAGFACGTKLTAVPEVLLAVPVACIVAILITREKAASEAEVVPVSRRLLGVGCFMVVGVVTFSPWLIRNALWTGNVVFPEAMSVLGKAYFSDVQVERWRRAHRPPPEQQRVTARLRAAASQIAANAGYGYVFLPLVLAAGAAARKQRAVQALLIMLALHALFWLSFTHLQGRFFVLAVPIGALILAHAEWRRGAPVVLALIVAMGVLALTAVQMRLRRYPALSPTIGVQQLDELTPEALKSVPPGATVTLVGDARAFNYQLPMARLRYRTVFDVDSSKGWNAIDSWAGVHISPKDPGLLIDWPELARLRATYYAVPGF